MTIKELAKTTFEDFMEEIEDDFSEVKLVFKASTNKEGLVTAVKVSFIALQISLYENHFKFAEAIPKERLESFVGNFAGGMDTHIHYPKKPINE
jgi:hypothetical protein